MKDLDQILKFVKLTNEFQKVERVNLVQGEERYENDVEHSYQLAMVAWYIISINKLPLNLDLVLKYAMLHDVVEVYAGDTNVFDPDSSVHESKAEREHAALQKLAQQFPEFPEMVNIISQYELRNDEESRFVYALDKIIPPLNMYLDGGRSWQRQGVSLEQIIANKTPKVAAHPDIQEYFLILTELLTKEHATLWPQKNEEI